MAKRYYWLKLKNDFFNDKRIKKLRKIAGGDTYTLIYLKLMLKTLETDGVYEFEGIEEDLADELALELDEDSDNVQVTLNFLMQSGLMVELDENTYELPMVKESTGGECSSAKRVRAFRERQKALQCNTNVTDMKHFVNGEIEKEIEKEKELEIEIEKKDVTDYKSVVDAYNTICISYPHLKTLSESRKKAIRARLKQYTIDNFIEMFRKAEESSFLKGGNNRNWSATFDWMLKDANMAKILEGNYDDKPSAGKPINKAAQELNDAYEMMANWAKRKEAANG